MSKEARRRAYLDHASSSPLRPAALEAMTPWLAHPGDPGCVHAEGRAARVALEDAREQVAAFFGARPREVVFTSGGTEAVNTAIFGAAARATSNRRSLSGRERKRNAGFEEAGPAPQPASAFRHAPEMERRFDGDGPGVHILTSAVEHSAVLEAANRAGRMTMAGVDGFGRFDQATVLAGVGPDTALVSVQLANHAVGTVQPPVEVV